MSQTPRWVMEIESLARGLPVLLVEGEDDVPLLGHFLGQHAPDWQQRLYLVAAGGKGHVISGVAVHRLDWLGIVYRDEWSIADVAAAAARSPRLHVLPRFCTESYFCDPAELWAALPTQQQAGTRGGQPPCAVAGPIHAELPDWVAHGAMWRVLRDLYKDARLPAKLEDSPVTDETTIRGILTDWHIRLAPDPVLAHYRDELGNAHTLAAETQLQEYIHGKKFFNQVVIQVLDGLFAGKGADDWLQKFRDAPIQPPPDLTDLFNRILAQLPQTGPKSEPSTFLDALVAALQRAGSYNKNDQCPPAAILWPDKERQWEPLLPALRERLPLLTLGPYAPVQRTGPAYWLRCMDRPHAAR